MLGAGPVADAFFVALRLPNHFRAIFAEGAFNAAFVPAYARIREEGGGVRAGQFADRIFTLLLASQIVLLAVALVFTPAVIDVLAPGFARDPERFALAVELTRITFPYLAADHAGHALWRHPQCAAAFRRRRRRPILLNLSLILALALAAFFPTAGHAAAWGVLVAGILEFLLVAGDAGIAGVLHAIPLAGARRRCAANSSARSARPWSAPPAYSLRCSPTRSSRAFCRQARCPRFITPTASISCRSASSASPPAPSFCPRCRVGLPHGDQHGAAQAQNRAIEFTLLLSIPCIAAFFVIPDLIMRALFMRGAFTAADAEAAAHTLTAYAFGLLPFVLIRSAVATFFARGDTATPVKAALIAAAVNIAFKVLLMGPLAQVGLALATSIGAWINLGLVIWFAARAGHLAHDARLRQSIIQAGHCRILLGRGVGGLPRPGRSLARRWDGPRDLAALAVLGSHRACRLWRHRPDAVRLATGSRHFAASAAAKSTLPCAYCLRPMVDIGDCRRYGDRPCCLSCRNP